MSSLGFFVLVCFFESHATNHNYAHLISSVFGVLCDRPKVNYESVFECLVTLTGTDRIAEVLKGLAESDESRLVAYQLAFVLYDTAPQGVLHGISALLPSSEPNDVASKIRDILAGEYTGGTTIQRVMLKHTNTIFFF